MCEENENKDVQPTIDVVVGNQLSALALTNALSQQQLNSAAARNALGNAGNILTLGVQLNQMATLQMLSQLSPITASAMEQLLRAGFLQHTVAMDAATAGPKGTKVSEQS